MDRTEQKPSNLPISAGGQSGRLGGSAPGFSPCDAPTRNAAAFLLAAAGGRPHPSVGMASNPDF